MVIVRLKERVCKMNSKESLGFFMRYVKSFLQYGFLCAVISFLILACSLILGLFLYQSNISKDSLLSSFYIGDRVNILLALSCAGIISVLIGITISTFVGFVPKNNLELRSE